MNPFTLLKQIGVKVPLGEAVIAAASQQEAEPTIRGAGPSNNVFFAPGQPLRPQAQETARDRQWDYPWGSNLAFTPRSYEPVSFGQLRALADSYDLLRLLIETRKDQLVKFEWSIVPKDESKEPDDRCKDFARFLQFPDRRHNWQTWLRILVEDMLVTDAACLQPVMTRGGQLYALDLFDGATLHVAIDDTGRVPLPPDVAYQQIIKGIPAVNYTSDELIYAPRNMRVNRLYGYPPVEQILVTVNIGLRRQLNQLQYFTEGNIPEALMSVPKEWTASQIRQYQDMWDDMYSGNTAQRRHLKFVPDGSKYIPTKEEVLKDAFDEWLARVCCYAFSLPAAPFVRDQNRATAETAKEAAIEEGLHPLMSWVKDIMDLVLWKYCQWDDLQFAWQDEDPTSPVELATMNAEYVKVGIKSVDECRQDIGLDSVGMPNAVYTGQGVILLKDILHPEDNPLSPAHPDNPQNPANIADKQAQDQDFKERQFGMQQAEGEDKKDTKEQKDKGEQTHGAPAGGTPPATKLDLHVHMPKAPDVLVDIGDTTINATFDKATKRITTTRMADGEMVAVVDEGDGKKQIIKARRDADGSLNARVDDASSN